MSPTNAQVALQAAATFTARKQQNRVVDVIDVANAFKGWLDKQDVIMRQNEQSKTIKAIEAAKDTIDSKWDPVLGWYRLVRVEEEE